MTRTQRYVNVTALCLIAALPWIGLATYPKLTPFVWISAAATSMALVAAAILAKSLVLYYARTLDVSSKWIFFIVVTVMLVIQVLCSPGVISNDDRFLLEGLAKGFPSEWHSFSYSFLQEGLFLVFHRPFMVGYLNILLFALLTAQCLHLVRPMILRAVLLLILVSPLAQVSLITQNRDTIFTMVFLVSFVEIVRRHILKIEWTKASLFTTATAIGFLSNVRSDGVVFGAAFLLGLIFVIQGPKPLRRSAALVTVFVWVLLTLVPRPFYSYVPERDAYAATLMVHPLSYIMYVKGEQTFKPEDLADLNRFFIADYLIQYYNPYDIDPFHKGGIRPNVQHEDYLAFRAATIRTIASEPRLWVKSRIPLIRRMLGVDGQSVAFYDSIFEQGEQFASSRAFFNYKPRTGPKRELEQRYHEWFADWTHSHDGIIHILFETCFIPLLALLLCLFSPRVRPALFLLSAACLVRSAAVLIIAPAAYFKYVSSLWLGGWIVLVLLIADYCRGPRRILFKFFSSPRGHAENALPSPEQS